MKARINDWHEFFGIKGFKTAFKRTVNPVVYKRKGIEFGLIKDPEKDKGEWVLNYRKLRPAGYKPHWNRNWTKVDEFPQKELAKIAAEGIEKEVINGEFFVD